MQNIFKNINVQKSVEYTIFVLLSTEDMGNIYTALTQLKAESALSLLY